MARSKAYAAALKYGYRSGLELKAIDICKELVLECTYEEDKIKFVEPEKHRTYTPDLKIRGTYWELKGRWLTADRLKHKLIREQHPDIRIVIVFQNSRTKITAASKTSYGDYATKIGVEWIDFKDFKDTLTKEYK